MSEENPVVKSVREFSDHVVELRERHTQEYDDLKDRLERMEALSGRPRLGRADPDDETKAKETKAFLDYLRDGNTEGLVKSITVGTDSAGGYTIPTTIDQTIEVQTKHGTPWLDLCTVKTGAADGYRHLVTDRTLASSTSAETGTRSETATMLFIERVPTYGEVYSYPKVSRWAVEDSQFDVMSMLTTEIGDEFSNKIDNLVINGTGSSQMTGFLHNAPEPYDDTSSPTRTTGVFEYLASGAAATIPHTPSASPQVYGPDILISLIKKLRAPYRRSATWVMNSNTLSTIMQWRDLNGRSYVNYDMTKPMASTLLGYPIAVSESMDDIGANKFPIGFGDWKRAYLITKYGTLTALQDPYTTKGYVYLYTAQRYGGIILNDQAVKLLKCATS